MYVIMMWLPFSVFLTPGDCMHVNVINQCKIYYHDDFVSFIKTVTVPAVAVLIQQGTVIQYSYI